MNRHLTFLLAAASALAVVAGVITLVRDTGTATTDAGRAPLVHDSGTAETLGDARAPSTDDPVTPAVREGDDAQRPAVGVRSGRLEDLPRPGPPPVRVHVESLGIDASVVDIGVEDGVVTVPDDVDVVGWYRYGPAPGSPGSAVLTAHVDSAAQGAGAFFPLRKAEPGAQVTIDLADGSQRSFEVVGRRSYPKDTLPVDELFARSGDPTLTLITCGGAFDPVTRSYEENVVVFATPLDRA